MGHIHIMSNNEIGYAIIKKFQNKGIGTECVEETEDVSGVVTWWSSAVAITCTATGFED